MNESRKQHYQILTTEMKTYRTQKLIQSLHLQLVELILLVKLERWHIR